MLRPTAFTVNRAGHAAATGLLTSSSTYSLLQPWLQQLSSSFRSVQQQPAKENIREKYKGVYSQGRKWVGVIWLPQHLLPGQAAGRKHHLGTYPKASEAAAQIDLNILALHGAGVKQQHLNFPAGDYSQSQIAAAWQQLKAKIPDLSPPGQPQGTTPDSRIKTRHTTVHRPSLRAAAALVAGKATAYRRNNTAALVGACKLTNRPGYRVHIPVQASKGSIRYTITGLATCMEAAVVYDLVRYNLYGPEYTVNLPAHMYSDSDVQIVRQDMQHMCPDIFLAALQTSIRQPPYKRGLILADKAADVAVESAAAKAAAAAAQSGSKHSSKGVTEVGRCIKTRVSETITFDKGIRLIWHIRCYKSVLAAAVAYDMMLQALDRPAVNLPASITAALVPAMKVWMEMNRTRLTVEKEQWARKAAALKIAPEIT